MKRKKMAAVAAGFCLLAAGGLLWTGSLSAGPEDGDGAYVETVAVAGEEDVVIRCAPAGTGRTAITCNVDWGEDVIPGLLDICREKDVTITFFVTGKWAEKNPWLLRKMYLAGHEIQSHGYAHTLCSQASAEKIREELEKTEEILEELLGVTPGVFAPPSGDYDAGTVELCRTLGYTLSLWSADTIDWREGSTAEVIKERILGKELDGGIVLMHPKEETAKALPELIDEMRSRGLEPGPLRDLGLY
ncbi:MAG: polysaccharide deacetylase family protein [Bacillota bacterium]|nr:polysaccharide deacetylase family protein [Bacillota bacterium]